MKNNEPTKLMNNLYKRYLKLQQESGGMADKYDYKAEEQIKKELRELHSVTGACELMSKKSLWQLIRLNGTLRAIPFHQFHFPFTQALDNN